MYICIKHGVYNIFLFYVLVPTPDVSITPPVTQLVGDPLTLQCEVTTVRGITSRVDIVWSSGDIELTRMKGVSSTTTNNSLVYTHSYTISQLSTTDDGRVIQCEVVIDGTSPSVMATDSITLDVTGEYCMTLYLAIYMLLLYTQFRILQSPYHLIPYEELWWVVLKLSFVQ